MNKFLVIYVIIILAILGCQNEKATVLIEREYVKLKNASKSDIQINSIRILQNNEWQFEKIAEYEIQRMLKINDNLSKIVELQFKRDSLLRQKIDRRYNYYKYVNKERQLKYEKDIEQVSKVLLDNINDRLQDEMKLVENELRIKEIRKLASSEAILQTECRRIKHEIDFIQNDKHFKHTMIFIGFANMKYNYLTINVFNQNE